MNEQLATIQQQPPTTGALIAAAIQSGITKENVDVVERLCALKEREQKADAERAFAAAFAALQSETPKITACKVVPDREGNAKYSYAPYEEIWKAVRPLLTKYNFAVSYDQDIADGRVIVTCKLSHIGGHSQSNRFQCRIGSGPPKASEAQGDGAATTYAKRFALCAALGIMIEQNDTDGKNEGSGERITAEQAEDFRARCLATNTDALKFCKWLAGPDATSFDEIPANRWADGDAQLKKREKK